MITVIVVADDEDTSGIVDSRCGQGGSRAQEPEYRHRYGVEFDLLASLHGLFS
jgi:hypothetical protein